MNKGLLIVLTGPSGVGKGTVVSRLLSEYGNVVLSVSATTRSPRSGEENGREYYFVTTEEFSEMIENGGVLEYTEYCGNFYGTPKERVNSLLSAGKDVILEIELEGARNIKNLCPDCVSIFVMPPSYDVLYGRLKGRGTESDEAVGKRLKAAMTEMQAASEYDYVVINNDVDDCASSISGIIQSEKMRANRNINFIKEVLLNAQSIS